MKTKLYFTAIMLLGFIGVSNAQAQNQECMTNLSIYVEHAKVKNYEAAYTPWKMVYDNCPDINWANFAYGERILKDRVKNSSGADKDANIQDLLSLYENSGKYFPKKAPLADVLIDQVLLKYNEKMIENPEIYDLLSRAFKEDLENFKNPRALYLYFSSLVDLHKAGSKELQEVFDVYDDVTEKIEDENIKLTDRISQLLPKEEAGTLTSKEKKRLKAATTNSKSFGKIAGSIDTKLGDLADCGNLIPLYQKSFDAKKGDLTWVKRAVGRMFAKECTDDPLFSKMVEVQAELDPSADVYVYLGTLKNKKGDTKGAVADFNKALELETDARKRSNIAYKVATIYRRGSKSTARSYAQKAINANPSNGKAYLLIASLYASSANQCGTTPFEKRAIYWRAAEMARKAGRVDPSLSGRANQSAASYSAKAPSKTDIFNSGMAGKTVSFKCWVGGSVKVPNL
ncbi:tetratricopeptide repeat protein [Maribacter sp. HTCC2170]|uniref:tetratricopeptide repeat protein n=1 Tax=Maribacter sp. (strain HTCC2170 / KCCM 42371) TaxID=313603 RepID=UPI0002F17EDB|nr:tetratricopeptide repeat protein [Maribacter sp. HTCC2170]